MDYSQFQAYKELPCRFKLKSGKEVYGVVWEQKNNEEPEYYFASYNTFSKIKSTSNLTGNNYSIYKVSLEDLGYAEPMALVAA
ncbi:MAG: hypothetical protein J0M08_08030 [Bacteroidetes bacterium]|nr:hypothetical protein [Bacteroidota bacterium]